MIRLSDFKAPFASHAAFMFLVLLFLAPVVGAQLVAERFVGADDLFAIKPINLARTRDAIDKRFHSVLDGKRDKREAWSELVRTELEAGRLASARGVVLAGPELLPQSDSAALRAAAFREALAGDEAIETAALRYLADDVRDLYERSMAPGATVLKSFDLPDEGEGPPSPDAGTTEAIDAPARPDAGIITLEKTMDASAASALNVLGDARDLAIRSNRWLRDEPVDTTDFRISGLGQTVFGEDARPGASILRSALRAERLNPELRGYVERRLDHIIPLDLLRERLDARMAETSGLHAQGEAVLETFRQLSDPSALAVFEADLSTLRQISVYTSPTDAISFLESARNGMDMRRALLVARAGGDRAVALAHLAPGYVLDTAQSDVPWNNRLRMMVICLSSIGLALLWLTVDTCRRSLRLGAPVRRSAIHLLEEPAQPADNRPK